MTADFPVACSGRTVKLSISFDRQTVRARLQPRADIVHDSPLSTDGIDRCDKITCNYIAHNAMPAPHTSAKAEIFLPIQPVRMCLVFLLYCRYPAGLCRARRIYTETRSRSFVPMTVESVTKLKFLNNYMNWLHCEWLKSGRDRISC